MFCYIAVRECHVYSAAVQVSKEDRQAHVTLATSEYSFITWLDQSGYLYFTWLMITLLRMFIALVHLQNWALHLSGPR